MYDSVANTGLFAEENGMIDVLDGELSAIDGS